MVGKRPGFDPHPTRREAIPSGKAGCYSCGDGGFHHDEAEDKPDYCVVCHELAVDATCMVQGAMQIRLLASVSWAALILVVTWGYTELSDGHSVHPDNWSIEHQTKVRSAGYDLTSFARQALEDLPSQKQID